MLLRDKLNTTNEIFAVTLVGGDGHRYFTRRCTHMRSPVLFHFGKRDCLPQPKHTGCTERRVPASNFFAVKTTQESRCSD
jgi:hypothetical protein